MNIVEIIYEGYEETENLKVIANSIVREALSEEDLDYYVDVDITFTNNENIQLINKEYRDKNVPTDVLSFPMLEPEELNDPKALELNKDYEKDVVLLGDIIISLEKVEEQAKEYNHSFEREVAYMITHGMFHLLGYDHLIESEKEIMRQKEEKVLSKLNILR